MNTETQCEASHDDAQTMALLHGKTLTKKRTRILALLMQAQKPISAYELTDLYNASYDEHIIANSVYRILDWLVVAGLAHRLDTVNKFIACDDERCIEQSGFSIFIICKICQITTENHAPEHLQLELLQQVSAEQYSSITPHLELMGICKNCLKTNRRN